MNLRKRASILLKKTKAINLLSLGVDAEDVSYSQSLMLLIRIRVSYRMNCDEVKQNLSLRNLHLSVLGVRAK